MVAPSAIVTWTWTGGGDVHNVTFASNAIPNSVTQQSGTHQATMPASPGAFDYQCTIHPTEMNGTVTVQSGEAPYFRPATAANGSGARR